MIIYKVTNKAKNLSYIGKTKFSLEKRKQQHLKNKRNNYFENDLQKHPENFGWEVIMNCLNSINLLNEAEKFFIDRYNTKIPNGYNLTDGGEGNPGWIPSKETRKKLSDVFMGEKNPMFGKKRTDVKERNRQQTGEKNPMFGRHHTEETIEKNREKHIGNTSPFKGKHHSKKSLILMSKAKIGKSNTSSTKFKKGHIPWNKGRKNVKDNKI